MCDISLITRLNCHLVLLYNLILEYLKNEDITHLGSDLEVWNKANVMCMTPELVLSCNFQLKYEMLRIVHSWLYTLIKQT